ncbi:hypothetical protein AVEN_199923-1, partial [Araneus ventricosus]
FFPAPPIADPDGKYQFPFLSLWFHSSNKDQSGLMVRSRPWDRKVPGSKHNSTQDPPSTESVAR